MNSAHLLSPRLSEYYDPRYFEKMADGFESPYPCCPLGSMNQLETREAEEVARKPIVVHGLNLDIGVEQSTSPRPTSSPAGVGVHARNLGL